VLLGEEHTPNPLGFLQLDGPPADSSAMSIRSVRTTRALATGLATVGLVTSGIASTARMARAATKPRTQPGNVLATKAVSGYSAKPATPKPLATNAPVTTRALPATVTPTPPTKSTTKPTTTIASTTSTTIPADFPASSIGPSLAWSDEFETLSIASAENPEGLWRANNAWHNLASPGFKDYAGANWNVNPSSPGMQAFSPFSVVDGALRIRTFRTPSALKEIIRTEMDKDERTIGKPIPAWSGGVLMLNQEVKTLRYGYVEIRARLPQQGKGMFPALWLYAKTGDERAVEFDVPREKQAAEIDIFEAFGVPNQWATTLHRKARDESGPTDSLGVRNEDTTRWHTYGLEWKPNLLRVYRDGVKLYDVAPNIAGFFDVDMVIRINYAMDGSWFKQPSDASTPDLTMDIDYVRVYKTKPQ
jgi:beta-glucanase (GH16 family)